MELNFKVNNYSLDVQDGLTLNVADRIPVTRKNAIIVTCLKNATADNVINRLDFEASLYTMMIFAYTDILNKVEGLKDMNLLDCYDILDSNNIMGAVFGAINESNPNEINGFLKYADALLQDALDNLNSAGNAIFNLASTLTSTGAFLGTLMKNNAPEKPEADITKN